MTYEELIKKSTQLLSVLDADIELITKTELTTEFCKKMLLKLPKDIYDVLTDYYSDIYPEELAAKVTMQQKYNNCYLYPATDKQKPTTADLAAFAEGQTVKETTIVNQYTATSKLILSKVDWATRVLNELELIFQKDSGNIGKHFLNE